MSFGVRYLSPILASLACRNPRLKVDVSFSDSRVDLIAERFDAAIRIGSLPDSSLIARKIAAISSLVVASPDYLVRAGKPQTPHDLISHQCIIYTGRSSPDWVFLDGKSQIAIRPAGRLKTDSGETIIAWAMAGLGIAHLPLFLVSDAIERGALVPLLEDYPTPEMGMFVVRPPGTNTPAKVRVLIDTLVEQFSGKLDWERWRCPEREPGK